MEELSLQQERELTKKLRSASSVAEIQEVGSQLGMDFTEELAKEYLETINQDKPEKDFMELLREAHATDDETKKKEIYDKIVEQEKKRVRMDMFDKWLESEDKQEFITLGLQLDPKATKEEMEKLFDKSMAGYRQKGGLTAWTKKRNWNGPTAK